MLLSRSTVYLWLCVRFIRLYFVDLYGRVAKMLGGAYTCKSDKPLFEPRPLIHMFGIYLLYSGRLLPSGLHNTYTNDFFYSLPGTLKRN